MLCGIASTSRLRCTYAVRRTWALATPEMEIFTIPGDSGAWWERLRVPFPSGHPAFLPARRLVSPRASGYRIEWRRCIGSCTAIKAAVPRTNLVRRGRAPEYMQLYCAAAHQGVPSHSAERVCNEWQCPRLWCQTPPPLSANTPTFAGAQYRKGWPRNWSAVLAVLSSVG